MVEQGALVSGSASVRTQWLRLAAGAVVLRGRHVLRVLADALFGLRAQLLFWLMPLAGWLVVPPHRLWYGVSATGPPGPAAPGRGETGRHWTGSPAGDGRCVLVSNHESYLDGLVLVAALEQPHTFVAKRELEGQFVAGRFLKTSAPRSSNDSTAGAAWPMPSR